jgi:hypothetical protein
LSVGCLFDRLIAIHERINVRTSLRLCPASAINAIEFDKYPAIPSAIMNMMFIEMPILKALLSLIA